jgi:hypothetical protein
MGQYSHLFTVKNDQVPSYALLICMELTIFKGPNQVAGSSYATDQVEQWSWGGNLTGQTNNLWYLIETFSQQCNLKEAHIHILIEIYLTLKSLAYNF